MERLIRLKPTVWEREGDDLHAMTDKRQVRTLSDPDGTVEAFLRLLAEPQSTAALTAALTSQFPGVTAGDVQEGIEGLDSLGMLEDVSGAGILTQDEQDRFLTNLVFFQCFATLDRPKEEMQKRLMNSRVLVLGTGGTGSNVLMHLVGAGVGYFALVEPDVVESRNFSRQFIYRHADLGRSKVERAREWILEYSPGTKVDILDQTITCAEDVAKLLTDIDLVMVGIDTPPMEIAGWVNRACVAAGVPQVRGGMGIQSHYVSVNPGHGACVECSLMVMRGEQKDHGTASVKWRLLERLDQVNRGIGPVAGQISALMAMEGMRYLSGFAEPAAAGIMHIFDLASGEPRKVPWTARPDCPVCPTAGTHQMAPT